MPPTACPQFPVPLLRHLRERTHLTIVQRGFHRKMAAVVAQRWCSAVQEMPVKTVEGAAVVAGGEMM